MYSNCTNFIVNLYFILSVTNTLDLTDTLVYYGFLTLRVCNLFIVQAPGVMFVTRESLLKGKDLQLLTSLDQVLLILYFYLFFNILINITSCLQQGGQQYRPSPLVRVPCCNTSISSQPTNGPNNLEGYIALSWKDLPGTNTLAYWAQS